MSGIVGSRFNTRGSGLVGSLGTDGQVFTSAGAGTSAVFEAVAAGGKIGQVISASKIDTQSIASSSFVDVTDLTVAITPAATSSKIFWSFTFAGGNDSNYGVGRIVYGDGSALTTAAVHESAGDRIRGTTGYLYSNHAYITSVGSGQGLDSPNTTNATTYKIQIAALGDGFFVNRNVTWGDNATTYAGYGSITVMEVLA
jgi:hypothetical protein